jgi:hypothetical protein
VFFVNGALFPILIAAQVVTATARQKLQEVGYSKLPKNNIAEKAPCYRKDVVRNDNFYRKIM